MFCPLVEPRNSDKSVQNPTKFTKTRKIPQNSVEILSNICLYNIFGTYFSYWGYLLAVNLQIYLGTSWLKGANNVLKLPCVDYVAKNWALAMMLKALPLVHFWSIFLLKEQMMTSVRKTLKTLVWSAQKLSISSEICLENNHKISCFLAIAFWWSLPQKLLRNFCEIGRFFRKFFPKNPAKFDFTFHDQSEDLLYRDLLYQGSTVADAEVLLNIHCISWLLPKSSYSKYGLPQLVMKN